LLTHDRTKRFGCLKAGPEDIKQHKWFKNLDWKLISSRGVPTPFVPNVRAMDDTAMFDRYPESTEGSAPVISEKDQSLFESF
jgi:hypothetical protein